jgi:hypothetical protein
MLYALPFPFRQMLVQRARNLFQCFQIRTIYRNYFAMKFTGFAKRQERVESRRARACQARCARDDLVFAGWGIFSESNYGMTQKRECSGKRLP